MLFFWIITFRFKLANRSLSLLNWQVLKVSFSKVPSFYFGSKSPFDRKTFLRKRLWKSRCYKCKLCSMPFTANIEVEQEVVAACMITFFYIYTPADVYQHTCNRSQVATFAWRQRLPKLVYKTCAHTRHHGWRYLFQSGGGTSALKKTLENSLWFELATMTSQSLKYDVITYTPYEGLNCTILDKSTLLWKPIGEPLEIKKGCYRGDFRSTASLGLIRFILTE